MCDTRHKWVKWIFCHFLFLFFRYRDAGKEVIKVLCEFSDCVERASIDEAYIELTQTVEDRIKKKNGTHIATDMLKSSWVVGYDKTEDGDQQGML